MPTYQLFSKWAGKTPKMEKIGEMRNFQTFSAFFSTFLSFFGPFSALTPIRRAEIGDRTVLRVIIAAWCPRIAGAAVHT